MQVTIRLYRQHDMDLIHIYRLDGFRFANEMKKVLVSYANGTIYTPDFPETIPESGYVPKYHQTHFLLNDKDPKQKEAIDLLLHLKKGLRNSFLKALFRSCLAYLPLESFLDGDGMIMRHATYADIDKLMRMPQKEVEKEEDPVIPQEITPPVLNQPVGSIAPAKKTEEKAPEPVISDTEEDDLFDMMAGLSH